MQFVVTADGSNPDEGSTGGKVDSQSTRSLVNDSYDADVGARRGDIGGSGNVSGDAVAGARISTPWGAREPRWPRGGPCESGHGRGVGVCKGKGRAGSLVPEDDRGSALLGVPRVNTRSNSGGSGIEMQRGESRSCSDEDQRTPTSSHLRHVGGGKDGVAAGRRKRDRHERARTGRSLFESRGGGNESSPGTRSTSSTSIIRKTSIASVAVSAGGDVGPEGAAVAPWSVRRATDASMRRGGQCDSPVVSGADLSPDSSRQRPNARRRIDGGSGVNREEAKSSTKGEREGERSG